MKKLKNPKSRSRLSVPEGHQLKIARDTLKMPDAMADVMGGPSKAEAREIFRRLMAKARGLKENPRRRRSTNRAISRRRVNYGEGNLFNFHGAFQEKADAVKKEAAVPDSFIKPVWFKGGMRYGVLTQKNPRRKNSVIWGGKRKNYVTITGERTPAVERKMLKAAADIVRTAGWDAMAREFEDEPAKRKRIAQFISKDISKRWGTAKGLKAYEYLISVSKWLEGKNPNQSPQEIIRAFGVHRLPKTGTLVDSIRAGDRVTIVNRFGQKQTGRAVMPSSSGGWVLNLGGAHGTPGIASAENVVKVIKRKNSSRRKNADLVPFAVVFKRQGKIQTWERFAKTAAEATKSARAALANEYPDGQYSLITVKPKTRNGMAWGGAVDPKRDTEAFHKAAKQLYPGKEVNDLTRAEFSAVAKLAQELKTGKKNPVRKVPGGWRALGPKGRMGPVLPTQRDAEIYAESLRNPPAKRRRNFQERVIEGSRQAIITANEPSGPYSIRLYVNNGETATLMYKKAKTLAGARKIAQKMLDQHIRGNPKKVCGFMIGRNPCSRKPGHRGPHLPRGATLRPRSRVPGDWVGKNRRRNYDDAGDLYEQFHGRGAKKVTDTGLPLADYDNHPELGQLGRLVSLTIGDSEASKPWKKKIEWGSTEAPDLAAEPGGKQLYIVGGNQSLDDSLGALPIDQEKTEIDLGYAYQIEYYTQKKFDKFQPVTYWHDLGEETGEIPRVVYDRVKKRIHIVGGAYEVKPEGIVN